MKIIWDYIQRFSLVILALIWALILNNYILLAVGGFFLLLFFVKKDFYLLIKDTFESVIKQIIDWIGVFIFGLIYFMIITPIGLMKRLLTTEKREMNSNYKLSNKEYLLSDFDELW